MSCNRKRGASGLFIVLSILGGFVAANLLGTAVSYRKNMKKMKEKENQTNQMHSVTMGKLKVNVGEKTQNLFITCLSGKVDVNFNQIPSHQDVYVELFSIFGKTTINLPVGVNCICEGEGHFENVRNVAQDFAEEAEVTVHVIRKSLFSDLAIRPVRRWSK